MQIQLLVNRPIIKIVLLTWYCMVTCNCQEKRNILNQDDKAIITLMIDEYSFIPPPPPAIDSKNVKVDHKTIDSLNQLILNVAIWPSMKEQLNSKGYQKLEEKYATLVANKLPSRHIQTLNGIKSKKGHHVSLVDTLVSSKQMSFENVDNLFRFSRIYYNDEKSLAVFELGISQSRLAGSAVIYCLKKDKGSWEVENVIETTIW